MSRSKLNNYRPRVSLSQAVCKDKILILMRGRISCIDMMTCFICLLMSRPAEPQRLICNSGQAGVKIVHELQ